MLKGYEKLRKIVIIICLSIIFSCILYSIYVYQKVNYILNNFCIVDNYWVNFYGNYATLTLCCEFSCLTMVISTEQGKSIVLATSKVKLPRPNTHDLFIQFLNKIGGKVDRVEIYKLENNTYYAWLYIKLFLFEIKLDSRPSDAIALALRDGGVILIGKNLLPKSSEKVEEKEEREY